VRTLPIVAGAFAVVVVIWELPFIGSKTGLWPVLMLLAAGVILLAVNQVRHGG
jgi:hypothetical protein